MKFYYVIIVVAICCMASNGCATGLQRTNLQEWERKDFPSLGISMELPPKTERFKIYDQSKSKKWWKCKSCIFSMHTVYSGGIAEPLYLINFNMTLLDKNSYILYQQKKHAESDVQSFQNTKFHNTITEFNVLHPNGRTNLKCFRKDYKNEKTGEVVLVAITYLDNYEGNIKYKDEDIEAIKRILNSIKFLDNATEQ